MCMTHTKTKREAANRKAHRQVGELSSEVNDRLVGALDVRQSADDGLCFAHVEGVQNFRPEDVAVENWQTAGRRGSHTRVSPTEGAEIALT